MSRFASGISAPYGTPITASACLHPKHKASRAPLVNPYEKFTQSEFDAWIGDMTNTLRCALGYEQGEQIARSPEKNDDTNGHIPDYRPVEFSDGDEDPNDSFAQIKSRRAKGKARDPREGPGLGRGDRARPIEIVSSDEEEEEVEGLAFSIQEEQDDGDTDEDEDEDEEGEDEEEDENYSKQPQYSWDRGQSSSQLLSSPSTMKFGPPKPSKSLILEEYGKAELEEGDEEDELESIDQGYEREVERNIEYTRRSNSPKRNGASEVIAISDDEEDVGQANLSSDGKLFEQSSVNEGGEEKEHPVVAEEDELREDPSYYGQQNYELRHLRGTTFEEQVEKRDSGGSPCIEGVQPLDVDSCTRFLFSLSYSQC